MSRHWKCLPDYEPGRRYETSNEQADEVQATWLLWLAFIDVASLKSQIKTIIPAKNSTNEMQPEIHTVGQLLAAAPTDTWFTGGPILP
jgi:hypothetical protein